MKRLILIFPIALFIFISCDSPVRDVTTHSRASSQPQVDNTLTVPLVNTPLAKRDSVRKTVARQFRAKHGRGWKVSWNKNKATPLTVFAGTTQPVQGNPEKAAREFLAGNRSLFNMHKDLKDLELSEVRTSPSGVRHVRFQQTFHDIPIYNTDYQVHIRRDGRICMANGHYYQNISASTSPGISASSAKRTARSDLGGSLLKLDKKIGQPELMIYRKPKDETFTLAWRVLILAGMPKPGEWQYFIDASNGQIITKLNLAVAITGDGDVIEDNPLLTPTPVTQSFYRLDNSGYLRGLYANVHNDIASRAHSSTYSFSYSTSNTHFDEANVYFKIDTYRAGYLSNLGFNAEIGSDMDLEAYVHDVSHNPNNAKYYHNHESIRIGNNYEFAKAEKVIYHEFTHAMIDVVNGNHRFEAYPTEEGAIAEGLADYFPGSKTGRQKILESFPTLYTRKMENPYFTNYTALPRDPQTGKVLLEPHKGGEFFSSILWDLRNEGQLSHDMVDQLVYRAAGLVSGEPSFIEYRDAMMDADGNLNNGANNDLIQNIFAAKGVGNPVPPTPPPTPSNLTLTNLYDINEHPDLEWDCYGGDVDYYNLYRDNLSSSTSWTRIASPGARTYTDNGIIIKSSGPTRFMYKVTAVNQNGESSAAVLSDPSFPFFGEIY